MRPMRQDKQALVDYLRSKIGGALVMTSEELAFEIRVPAKQQSKLRKEARFPIPYQQTGRKVYYSVYAVADYLLDGVTMDFDRTAPPAVVPIKVTTDKKQSRNLRSQPEDMSQLFMLRNLMVGLEEQKSNIDFLHDHFTRYIQSGTLAEKLELELKEKNERVVMRFPS